MPGDLTPKQQRFVEEYLVDLNATRAAIRAGYSEKTACEQASRLLANVKVAAAIAEGKKQRSEETKITAEWVLNNLKNIAERCMQAAPVLDKKGDRVYIENAEGERVPAFTFDSAGANRSLELLGKHLSLFTDRQEITNPDGSLSKAMTDEQAAAKVDMIMRAAQRRRDEAGKNNGHSS